MLVDAVPPSVPRGVGRRQRSGRADRCGKAQWRDRSSGESKRTVAQAVVQGGSDACAGLLADVAGTSIVRAHTQTETAHSAFVRAAAFDYFKTLRYQVPARAGRKR